MITVQPSTSFEAVAQFDIGLTGTLGVRITDNAGATTLARATAGIAEYPAGSGIYAVTLTSPGTAGQYSLVWDDGTNYATDDLLVTLDAPIVVVPQQPTGKDLSTLSDVTSYVPAYTSNDTTDAKLQQLITSESLLIMEECGREIVGPDGVATRTFEISQTAARLRKIPIGDLNGLYDETVTILNPDGTTAQTVDASAIVPLYDGSRNQTRDWEPITELYLPWGIADTPVLLAEWQVLEVVAHWGFPSIPAFIREACAKRVILRYVSDVANAGTDFAQAVGESNLNLAAMFDSSEDAVRQLGGGIVIG